eukprot:TRINITY_DN4094_c0_g3_i1.p1 TRINITY_DN4094_c0_g3~~TRINITY_DN4094_c0_g3_i1.p1  ORF type:complete len:1007 (-),score=122.01 TRINITY_DN4094_c0_g3_i1:607-3627(-)
MPAGFWQNNFLRPATPGKDDPEPIITRLLDLFFGKLGLVIGKRPLVFIIIFLAAFGLLCVGLLKASTSFDIQQQWSSPNSRWVQYQKDFESAYGPFFRHTDILGVVKTNGSVPAGADDVVRLDVLAALFALEQEISKIEAKSSNPAVTQTAKLSDLCLRPSPQGECFITSPLWHWRYNLNAMMTDPAIRTTLGRIGYTHPLGFKITPQSIMGGAQVQYQRVLYAKLFKTTILFNNTAWAAQYLPDFDRQLKQTVKNFSSTNATVADFLSLDDDSVANSIAGALESDVTIIGIGFLAIFLFVIFTLGPSVPLPAICGVRKRKVYVESKIGLGIFGFLLVGLAFLAVQGLSAVTGIVISAITLQVLPVLLLGVGIDSVYILVRTFWSFLDAKDGLPDPLPRELLVENLSETLKSVGPSMLMSVLATSFIFVPVLTVDLPVISSLAAQVIIATWFNMILQIFVFAPAIVLDARRVLSGRVDLFCCCQRRRSTGSSTEAQVSQPRRSSRLQTSVESESSSLSDKDESLQSLDSSTGSTESETLTKQNPSRSKSNAKTNSSDSATGDAVASSRSRDNLLSGAQVHKTLSQKLIAVFFTNRVSQTVGILFFLALLGVSIFGALHVKVGLEISTLIPSNSAESRAYSLLNDNFNSSLPLFIVVLAGPKGEEGCLDYANPQVPKSLLAMKTVLESSGVLSDTLSFWYSDFVSWIVFLKPEYRAEYYANDESVPQGKLIPWLNEFLSSEGSTHMMTLQRAAPVANSTRFSASLMMGSMVPLDGLQLILNAVKQVETEMKPYAANSTLNCAKIVPYSPVFFALGQVDSFHTDAVRVVLASLVVVFLMTLVFIHNLFISFLSVVILGGLCVSVFALHIPLNLQLNGITIVNIALGLTLASEYLSYYMRAYISPQAVAQDPVVKPASSPACPSIAPSTRAVAAFSSVGGMLLLSIVSSILGMIVLLFTGYKIIRIYFGAMWLLIISLAALFALALFPWTLAILSRLKYCAVCCRCGKR